MSGFGLSVTDDTSATGEGQYAGCAHQGYERDARRLSVTAVAKPGRRYLRPRNPMSAMAMPISAMNGPSMDHVVVLLIGLPDTAPNPCNANSRPASATSTPSTTMAIRIYRQ
jgi:hypothetical protein